MIKKMKYIKIKKRIYFKCLFDRLRRMAPILK